MITIVLMIMIGIGAAPMILIGVPSQAQAKVSIEVEDLRYSGPRASMAVNSNNIYLTWWDNKTGNNEVYFGKSNDGGKTFGKPINLSDDKAGSADSQIAASGNNVYVTWWDNKTGNWQVFSRSSNDNGTAFGNAVMIKGVGGGSPVKSLRAPPSNTTTVDTIVASAIGNKEYVVWWDNTTGNWEVFLAKSTDGGKTFASPVNISNTPDARSVGARMVTQGDNNVYITWMDIKPNGLKQVVFRASNDGGQTFGNPIVVYDGSSSGNTVN
jgi:hypothetical protein